MSVSLTRRRFTQLAASAAAALRVPRLNAAAGVALGANALPMEGGRFQPNWESLRQYQTPEWFRDAKFGIWQHWGPQCVPEHNDWYARNMYQQYQKGKGGALALNPTYVFHCETYGHPTVFGFKDFVPLWKADQWDPNRLASLYKAAGARYVVQLANHHDNFDTWNSKYQPWNAVALGPRKDLVGGWSTAARAHGLRFGVSVHAARAWDWNVYSASADVTGPLAGVSYDGDRPRSAGAGKWWDGLDLHDLYAQNHGPKDRPDQTYLTKFYNRVTDLINSYSPDILNFDDDYTRAGLPLYGDCPEVGLRLMAHFYNTNQKLHGGQLDCVLTGKRLSEDHVPAMVRGIEQGSSITILPLPWQTETCLGHWHYDRSLYLNHGYAKSDKVMRMLVDIVSKNGNLLLSVPVRGNGSIDSDEEAIVKEIGAWMTLNGEAIYGSRPWSIFGEGPAISGYQENMLRSVVYSPDDWRFTAQGNTLYAFVMIWPVGGKSVIRSLGTSGIAADRTIRTVQILGAAVPCRFTRTALALEIDLPSQPPGPGPVAFRITA